MLRVWRVNMVGLSFFLIDIFFSISSFNIVLIKNYASWFIFYEVISISWLELRVWWVNPIDSSFFFLVFFNWYFFNFIFQHWIDYELNFMIYFSLFSMSLYRSYDLGHVFCRLTCVDWGRFIVSCFEIDFFPFNFNLQQ
jgi:hypothetical protein